MTTKTIVITYKDHEIRYKILEKVAQKNLNLPEAWFYALGNILAGFWELLHILNSPPVTNMIRL